MTQEFFRKKEELRVAQQGHRLLRREQNRQFAHKIIHVRQQARKAGLIPDQAAQRVIVTQILV